MADRTSARIFGDVFRLLSQNVEKNKKLAEEIFKLTSDYDFNYYQMSCDEELLKLGLAEMVDDIDEPGQKIIKYKGE